jgi:hypothetical protein
LALHANLGKVGPQSLKKPNKMSSEGYMYRYGMFAALAFSAVALMSGTTSADVATGAQLQVKPAQSLVQDAGYRGRHRHCRRHCHYVGPLKICKRKCHWR